MLDLGWERSNSLWCPASEELQSIFTAFDKSLTILGFDPIRIGCKNSNYMVRTNKGSFLLRATNICGFSNERAVFDIVKGILPVPDLLFHTVTQKCNIFIYEFIEGVSLQKLIIESNHCDDSLLEQVAKSAAILHSFPEEISAGLTKWDIPPFEVWFDFFLQDDTVARVLGAQMLLRVHRLVSEKTVFLPQIARLESLIHCDFRPANMLVDAKGTVFIVDWEFASTGHCLGDIGQFFRYRTLFSENQFTLFERVYNSFAVQQLPDQWVELSLFRDLVNPLHLLSLSHETPYRDADLIRIIENTLTHWNY